MKILEENFIIQLKKKNEKALDYVVDNYGWVIKSIVKKHLYSLQSTQDECINDILLAIWTNIDKFDEERSEFKNWVAGIAKYKSIDYKRKYLKHLEYENIDDLDISACDNTHEELIANELNVETQDLMSCLKKEDRNLFFKIYVEEKEIEDVIKDTGLKRDVIYNRISRGKKKIKNLFNIVESRG